MADSATAKKVRRPAVSFARRHGLASVSVAGALLLDVLFHHLGLPHPFNEFGATIPGRRGCFENDRWNL
jgi:hypothetical protein